MSRFVGSKNGPGVYQRIISEIPPHRVYIEPFAGRAAIFWHKRPAARSILIDSSPAVIDALGDATRSPAATAKVGDGRGAGDVELIVGDGIEFLRHFRPAADSDVFVYADPPYVRGSRRDPTRDYYAEEWTDQRHGYFLDVAVDAPWPMIVSGYWSELYADRLAGWRTESFWTTTRAGEPAEEWLWANFPKPDRLHDYRYIGGTFDERWRVHKRQRSWARMLRKMDPLERRAMLAAIAAEFPDDLAGRLDESVSVPGHRDTGGDARSTGSSSCRLDTGGDDGSG